MVTGPLYTLLYLLQIGDWDYDEDLIQNNRDIYQQYNLNHFSFIELAKFHYFNGSENQTYVGRMPYLVYGEIQDIITTFSRLVVAFPTFWI